MKIIVDCDPGNGIPGANVDDAIALSFAARSPACDLRAVWTVCGNTSASEGENAALRLFEELGIDGVPVTRGWCHPVSGTSLLWRSRLDAPSLNPEVYSLWESDAPERTGCSPTSPGSSFASATSASQIPHGSALSSPPITSPHPASILPEDSSVRGTDASSFTPPHPSPTETMADDLLRSGQGTILACLGPLTNIARVLRERPDAVRTVERIVLMGGCLGYDDLVDTNFAVDPQAARDVLASGIPLTVVPLDVTRTTELSPERWGRITRTTPPQHREDVRAIAGWLTPWMTYSRATRPVNGMWLHDVVVLAALTQPSLVSARRERLSVSRVPDGKLVCDPEGTEVELVTRVDNEGLIDLWAQTVLGVAPSDGKRRVEKRRA